jgi:PAT family beta-lactamase induction signal transducer AmpG
LLLQLPNFIKVDLFSVPQLVSLLTLQESAPLRYGTFFYLYFMQGVPSGFALTALVNYLAGQGIGTASVGTFITIVSLPWMLQLVWGPLIDRYRYSVVGHYKHWVLLTQLAAFLASLSLLTISRPEAQLWGLALVFFIHSVFASVQDASVDAMAIDVVPAAERGRLNAFMRGGILWGISFGAAALSVVLHRYGFRTAVLVQSGLLLFFTLVTFFIRLQRTDPLLPILGKSRERILGERTNLSIVFGQLWRSITEKARLQTAGIIVLSYFAFGVFIRSFNFHLIQKLHWPDQKLSVLQGTWGSLFTFFVLIAGGVIADRVGPRKLQLRVLLFLSLFLLVFNALSYLWNRDAFVTSGLLIWSVADPFYSVAAFPILMMLCTPAIEGSQFTAYMALINMSDIGGAFISGWALHIFPAPALGFACGLLLLLCSYWLYKQKKALAVMATAA